MKASKFFKLKEKWSLRSSDNIENINNEIVQEEIKPIEELVEEVKEVKTTIKKKKNETITQ